MDPLTPLFNEAARWPEAADQSVSCATRQGMRYSSILFLALALGSLEVAAGAVVTWEDVIAPAPGAPRSVGSHTAGCVQGALALPPEGQGFQSMRRSRRRFFAHPMLIRYVQVLGEAVARQGLGVLAIGDLGQARGGPTPFGHRSHQNGLDVDIWFSLLPRGSTLTDAERETMEAPSMVSPEGGGLDERHWSWRQAHVLQLAAGFDVVARIFVHARIKQALCQQFPEASWLHKLRPWWGHDDHFHVRLRCPMGESACQEQEPAPDGNGCGAELAWWFTEDARRPPPRPKVAAVPLPAACKDILRQ